MKNLTLQMTETAVLKKPAETVNKSNAVSGKDAETNSSFQAMLDKQVKAKHSSANEAQAQQNKTSDTNEKSANSVEATTKSDVVKENAVAQISAQKMNKLHLAKVAKDSAQALANLEMNSTSKRVADIEKTAMAAKETEGSDTEEVLLTSSESALNNGGAVNLNVAAMPLSIDVAKTNGMLNTVQSQEASTTLGVESQRNLKAEINSYELSNALTQNKPIVQSEASNVILEDKQSNSNWLEAMLPNAAKLNVNDAAANAKFTFNATQEVVNKDMAIKESGFQEIAITANFQSTVSSNGVTTMQVPGSSNLINAYPGKTGWDQAISQKVVWMLGAQEQSATLTLNPPELGPLQVVINVHNDQANATFTSDNAEVRQALQDGMANLREKLNESGIQLGQANVNSGGQAQQQFQKAASQQASSSQGGDNASASSVEMPRVSHIKTRVVDGLVDTFA